MCKVISLGCPILCTLRIADDVQDTFRPAAAKAERRSYDLYITYSKFYQVPQFWLVGFSESKVQLDPKHVRSPDAFF